MPRRGPPYNDDPGCQFVVIEDPWPGNATGKDRKEFFLNYLSAWVRFMLGKEHDVECIYTVNTRNEVIVRLPQDADIAPIIGAHPWRRFLHRGFSQDADRVSYVFAYNYRIKGDPGKHNWQESYPNETGDPPPHHHFPVKFPYPHVSWASLRNKNCADIALPLPPAREPTPIPDRTGFTPYQHPSQLTPNTVDNAAARREEELREVQRQQFQRSSPASEEAPRGPLEEDEHALQSLRHSSSTTDVKPRIKTESHNPSVKPEEAPHGPSETFRSAIEELQRARNNNTAQRSSHSIAQPSMTTSNGVVELKREDIPNPGPSDSFIAAFNEIRRGNPSDEGRRQASGSSAKLDPDLPPAPSGDFVAAFNSIRGRHGDSPNSSVWTSTDNVSMKQETGIARQGPGQADRSHVHVKSERDVRRPSSRDIPPSNARRSKQDPPGLKRVKGEDRTDGPGKRLKRENYY